MEKYFEQILDSDEKVIKAYKPHKCKFYFENLLGFALIYLVICVFFVVIIASDPEINALWVLLPIGAFALLMTISWLLLRVYYNNNFYAYTNKRIIIRTGIIGVDYKSLDMSMIGIVNVRVGILDKILRKNTGQLCFGSVASNAQSICHHFSNIENPYESCKEIKSAIDKCKQKHPTKL